MNIYEAVKNAYQSNAMIMRESWPHLARIEPTDSPLCCVVHAQVGRFPRAGWQPQLADLIAEDRVVISNKRL